MTRIRNAVMTKMASVFKLIEVVLCSYKDIFVLNNVIPTKYHYKKRSFMLNLLKGFNILTTNQERLVSKIMLIRKPSPKYIITTSDTIAMLLGITLYPYLMLGLPNTLFNSWLFIFIFLSPLILMFYVNMLFAAEGEWV